MNAIMSNPFFPLMLVAVLVGLAVLPTFIAIARQADDIMLIIVFNILGCATVFGWVIALVMAIRWPRRFELDYPPKRR
jgi:hypothetical protein